MKTIVGIFISISRENSMLSWVEHEESFTRGPSGPEIAHLDLADHDMLHCAMVAILAIRLHCL